MDRYIQSGIALVVCVCVVACCVGMAIWGRSFFTGGFSQWLTKTFVTSAVGSAKGAVKGVAGGFQEANQELFHLSKKPTKAEKVLESTGLAGGAAVAAYHGIVNKKTKRGWKKFTHGAKHFFHL
jgi:hypothetical protein